MLMCVVSSLPNPVEEEMLDKAFGEAGRLLPPSKNPAREMKAHVCGPGQLPTNVCIIARRALSDDERTKIVGRLSPFAVQTLLDGRVVSQEIPDLPA